MEKTDEKSIEEFFIEYGKKYASRFMFSNDEEALLCEQQLNKSIIEFTIADECPHEKNTDNINGLTFSKLLKEGNDNTIIIWIKKTDELKTLALTILHENNHATALLNSIIMKDPITKKKYKYVGFYKSNVYTGERAGNGLDEWVNEFLTHMQFFHYFKNNFKHSMEKKTADTVFKPGHHHWIIDNKVSCYEYAMSIPKLLARACENYPYVNYEELLNNNISPVTGIVVGRNGEKEYINDMFYSAKYTSLGLKAEINRLSHNPRTYDRLTELTDTILKMNEYGLFDPINPSEELKYYLKETFDIIKDYHDQKAMKHLESGFWNEKDYEASNNRFNSMYQEVLHEFKIEDKNNNKNKRMVK